MAGAHIRSPDVLKDLRLDLLKYAEVARSAVAGSQTDLQRIVQWLKHTQLAHWKRELQRREEKVEQARRAYNEARFATPSLRKDSCVDEQKELRRAELARDEARMKIDAVKRWSAQLEQQAQKLTPPIHSLATAIEVDLPKANARLESMVIQLEEYLHSQRAGN